MGICSETRQLKDTVLNLQAATGVTDQSNYGNDGTLNGGMSIVDGAFVFDGVDDYVSVADYKDDQGTDFSYSLFFSLDDHTATGEVLFAQDTYGRGVMCQSWAGVIYVYIKSGTEHIQYTIPSYADDVFYHLVLTKKQADSYAKLFINGEEVAATALASAAGTDPTAAFPLNIGAQVGYGNLTGKIKSFRAFPRAITLTEIRELYNATARPDIAGTVLHLRPETGLVDQSGTQDPASYEGGMGVVGRRYVFDGTDDEINCGDITALNSSTAFTISGWFKQTTLDVKGEMFNKINDASNMIRCRTWSDGYMYLYVYNAGLSYGRLDYSTVVTAGEWFHLSMVFDGSGATNADRLKVYFDGVYVAFFSFYNTIPSSTPDLAGNDFGWSQYNTIGTAADRWVGSMHSLQVIDNALTAAQVLSLYEGVPGYEPPAAVRQVPDTVLHLEAASGERDLSNHCNYGTFTGTNIEEDSTDDAFVFNGSDDHVLMPTTPLVNSTQWSCSVWVKFNSVAAGNETIWGEGTAVTVNLNGVSVLRSGTGLFAYCNTTGASSFKYISSGIFEADKWYHVVVSVDDTAAATSIFINGVDPGGWTENDSFLSAPTQTTAGPILGKISTDTYTYDVDLDGELRDFRIIQRPISEGEAVLLYNKGVKRYRPVGLLGGEVLSYHLSRHDVGVLPDTVLQLDGSTGVTDQSSAGNDGTYNGGMGVTDGKFVLDGTDDYLSVPNAGEFASGESFTVAAWVKVSALPPFSSSIVVKGYGSAGQAQPWWMLLLDGAGAVGLQTRNTTPSTSTATGGDISDGEWHFVTGVYDAVANTLKTYVDASSVATASSVAAGAYGTNSSDLEIGGTHTSRWWGGELDDIRIINRALSATEVTTLYNNDITDESGNGNVGTLTNGAYIGESDEIVFDGTNDEVEVPINSDLQCSGNYTVSAWVTWDSSSSSHVFGCYDGNGWVILNITSTMYFARYGSVEGSPYVVGPTFTTGTEYHLAMTYDGTTLTAYVDGASVGSKALSGFTASANNVFLGRNANGGQYFDGSIRHPQIFNRALTAAEVAFLASEYEVETPNTKGSVLSIVPSFDDWGNATLNALDFSGNGNVGTLTNMTTGDWVADTDSGGTRALDFDGVDDCVVTSQSVNLSHSVTLSAWVNVDVADAAYEIAVGRDAPSNRGYVLSKGGFTASKWNFILLAGGGTAVSTSGVSVGWTHLVGTHDGVNMKIYVNGVLEGTTANTTAATGSGAYNIGRRNYPLFFQYFNGTIDDVYIWDRALSLDEIKALASTRNYFDCPDIVVPGIDNGVILLMGVGH